MPNIPFVCLYTSYLHTLSPFSDDEKGRIMTAMLNFVATGEEPTFTGNERFIWPSIQAQIERDVEAYQNKCAKNKLNGSKGGRPPKNQTVRSETERFSEEPKKAKENTKEKKKGNTKEMEKDGTTANKSPTRHKYGAYKNVLFTDEEYAKLQAEFPTDYSERVERMSEYIASTGKSYKSHLATIRSWARKDVGKAGTMPSYGGEGNWSL